MARGCAKHISKSKRTKHTSVGPLLEVEVSKKCTPFWREAHFEVKMYKASHVRSTFGSRDVEKKCTPLWRKAHVQVKMLKAPHARTTFEGSDVVLRGRRRGFCTLSKVSKTWGLIAFPKTMASVGQLQRICKDAFRVAGAVQETCSSEVLGGQGADFLRGVAFWSVRLCQIRQIFRCAKMILRDRCSTLYDLASLLRGRRSTLHRWSGKIVKNRKTHWYEAVSSALNFPF